MSNCDIIDTCSCCCHNGDINVSPNKLCHNLNGLDNDSQGEIFTEDILQTFNLRCVRHDHQSIITSIDWDSSGDCLLSCCRDSSVTLHSTSRNLVRHLYSRKYGAQGGKFIQGGQTHCIVAAKSPSSSIVSSSTSSILHSLGRTQWPKLKVILNEDPMQHYEDYLMLSGKPQHYPSALRHWDLQENRFIKTFHLPAPVISSGSLSVSQCSIELILAACQDYTVRIFTLEKEYPLVVIPSNVQRPLAVLSPNQHLAAVQILPFSIQLFDFKQSWDNSDYLCLDIEKVLPIETLLLGYNNSFESHQDVLCCTRPFTYSDLFQITCLQFASYLPYLFVTLTDNYTYSTILQLHIYTGELVHVFQSREDNLSTILNNHLNSTWIEEWKLSDQKDTLSFHFQPDVSRDGRYLACGTGPEQTIKIWSIEKGGMPIKQLHCSPRVPLFVNWNPTLFLLASACDHLAFWGTP